MKHTLISLACASLGVAFLSCSAAPAHAGGARITPGVYAGTSVVLQPNYSARLDHRLSWAALPVRVFFVPDKIYRADLERVARKGFDHWARATSGFARYVVVRLPQQADIFVKFNPDVSGGLTKTHFRKGRLFRADMSVGVAQDDTADIECTAAHEFGHALGIDGHSDDRSDLMFPVHVIGRTFRITESDVNTLAVAYPALAKKLAAQIETRTASVQTPMY